jgi:hypothetical protein
MDMRTDAAGTCSALVLQAARPHLNSIQSFGGNPQVREALQRQQPAAVAVRCGGSSLLCHFATYSMTAVCTGLW